jgi:Ca2+-transporting ATPase
MATLHDNSPGRLIYVKGSVEAIFKRCRQMLDTHGDEIAVNSEQVEQAVDEMAKEGLRVLALAKKLVPHSQSSMLGNGVNPSRDW